MKNKHFIKANEFASTRIINLQVCNQINVRFSTGKTLEKVIIALE